MVCTACGHETRSVVITAGQPPALLCWNAKCRKSGYYAGLVACTVDGCGKEAAEVVRTGASYTDFRCEAGHVFPWHASRTRMRTS